MSERELVERLERLERAHRRLKAFALVLVAVVVLWMARIRPSRSVEARELLPRSAGQDAATRVVQSYRNYPAKNDVVAALKDADYALRRFQEVTGQVNFGRWNVEHEFVDAAQQSLEAALRNARREMARIDAIQAGESVSALDLFQYYDALNGTDVAAGELGRDIDKYDSRDVSLAVDVTKVSTLAIKASDRVRDVFWEQIQAEESELEVCRSKPQK